MTEQVKHLTSAPALGTSRASFWGRNEAGIGLALDLLRFRGPIEVAILGSGIFEPLTTAASRRLPSGSRVYAYDNSPDVLSALRNVLHKGDWIARDVLAENSFGYQSTVPDTLLHLLEKLGVETRLLWDRGGRLVVDERIRSALLVFFLDMVRQTKEQLPFGPPADVIICNNVLPNISVAAGPSIVGGILELMWTGLRDEGVAVIGTISSHFYESIFHPQELTHFSGEIAKSLRGSPWKLLGWADRAYVREYSSGSEIQDGYMYIFLGKVTGDFNIHLSGGSLPGPIGLRPDELEYSCCGEQELWELSRNKHVPLAVRSNNLFSVVSTVSPFPQSLTKLFKGTNVTEISLGVCERLLLPA